MKNKHAWNLADLKKVKSNGKKVFSCFHCGGGSTMGYKLAGYDVLGGIEIDKNMMDVYKVNHSPKHSYLMPIQEFNSIPNSKLPKELFDLDILDGSPPCSSFSMAGNREDDWGKSKKFREGQEKQVLDDLFFQFIKTAKKLKPRVIIAENVKGLIQGNARGYVKQIIKGFEDIGYTVQIFLLNAAFMEVPQKRERVFFIAHKENTALNLDFDFPVIAIKEAFLGLKKDISNLITGQQLKRWRLTKVGEQARAFSTGNVFGFMYKETPDSPATTQIANPRGYHWEYPRLLNREESIRVQSFPDDFNFLKQKAEYVCGMSVPPKMMMNLSKEIYKQLLQEVR